MASIPKILGQVNPAATTATSLYTCPSATNTIISSLTVCNTGAAGTFRIAVRDNGDSLVTKHYLVYDLALAANDMISFTIGLTLSATDIVEVYASSANFAFSLFGTEIT